MVGKRLALLIANAEYKHSELRKLMAPHHDVRALEALLTRPDIGGYQTEVLVNETKAAMEWAIDRTLTDAERDDTVLIFFAGHGLKHENGTLFFAAVDTQPKYLAGTAVSAGWLVDQMKHSRVSSQIVLLDCCFGGAFARANVWARGDQVESGMALKVPDLEQHGRGQVVITAADAMQFAFEEGALKEGQSPASHFTRVLIEGLQTGAADADNNGKVTVDELMRYLEVGLQKTGSPQRPTKWIFGATGGDLLFAFNPRVKAPDWKEHVEVYLKANAHAEAIRLLEGVANDGDAAAMVKLGELYQDGLGGPRNCEKAAEWYRKAADAGSAVAMNSLALMYEFGWGRNADYAEAAEWYRKAAERGHVAAMHNLGDLYSDGRGVKQDYAEAAKWYRQAAERGHPAAMNHLAGLYLNGWGVPQDHLEAEKWYRKAELPFGSG